MSISTTYFHRRSHRLIRPLDPIHVADIVKGLKSNPQQYCILAGVLVEGELNDLTDSGKTRVEVIGGNHTRAAFQALVADGTLQCETLKVKVYTGLTTAEALQVGYRHNGAVVTDQSGRLTTGRHDPSQHEFLMIVASPNGHLILWWSLQWSV